MYVDEEVEGKNTIIQLYALFIVGLIMQFLPIQMASGFGMVIIALVAIAAYIIRRSQTDKLNFSANHCTNLIVTFWMSQLILTLSFALGLWLLISNTDMGAFNSCHTALPLKNNLSGSDVINAYMPCINVYRDGNMGIIILAVTIITLPTCIYYIYRLGTGLSRARKGYILQNPGKWITM